MIIVHDEFHLYDRSETAKSSLYTCSRIKAKAQ